MAALGDTLAIPRTSALGGAETHRFLTSMVLASLLPIPIFALLCGPLVQTATAQDTYQVLFLLSIAHGGLSGLFWLDRRYRAHMAAHPRAYYLDPFVIMLVSVTAASVLGAGFNGAFAIIYTLWTIAHFARQNWGVLCLAACGTGTERPGTAERNAMILASMGGAIGVLPRPALELLPDGTLRCGFLLTLAGSAWAIAAALRQYQAGANPVRVAMGIAAGLFFLPVYIMGPVVGFVTIGAAHGAQYALIMGALAADARQRARAWRIGGMLAAASVYIGLFMMVQYTTICGVWTTEAQVFVNTVTMWHFIVDAGLWRLSKPFQRQTATESLPFLFARRVQE